ncbi:Cellulose synthase operon protein C C-terminus (BCSC_C) [Terriglobus roseus DSM 18391]|uniref:Cellulose synthase operon protein C C-terminus (BCSC_C) n=1 Tax=Terriglobus roseus (strain DSM 18391 / NRRL B-41598 / KBS 63) TaxID=926566 RepID=I3ZES4_TERRK|nr:cellulose synthase subunit BcsC-related outer membrane protein [Terriglobus roseus]AFL87742.1 Cellulose synthase operon protein C C-terminus (BCSC_C) [Terriglobus roseus DSM 18391]
MAGRNPSRKTLLLLSAVLLGGSGAVPGQAQAPSASSNVATQALLEKARSLESRGRMDMAAQTWQQVLLADPNNTDALGGLARSAKMANNQALANTYLQRLKAINPKDPGIARAESVMAQGAQLSQLQQAGKMAAAGNYAEAMKIYRQVFGPAPPQGEWALAYYETEAATEEGRPHAVAGLRSMVDRYPQDSRYQIALGRILTYSPKTRSEGRRFLERHPNDPQATEALKQSLVWDAQNPASSGDIRSYLQKHRDPQLQEALTRNEAAQRATARSAAANRRSGEGGYGAGVSDDPATSLAARQHNIEENAAYVALNAKRFSEAEERFKSLLAKDPNDPRALAGMGYVRMNQQNFGGAISFMEQAKQDGATDKGLESNLATARYFFLIQEGGTALNENDLTTAEQEYRQALTLRANGPEALLGLGGTLAKAQQAEAAAPYYAEYVKLKPAAIEGWRGLFMSEYQAGNSQRALETERRLPANLRAQLMRDPDFLRTLASAYSAVGRDADAQRVLRSALDLPFPTGAQGVKSDTQLQYASLLLQANHIDQAAGLYRQVLSMDPTNTLAWEGLVNAQHAMHNEAAALQALESMPPEVYEQALREPGFLGTAAAIYGSQSKYDIAQSLLERAIARENTTGQKVPVNLQLQLAGLYLQRNDGAHAFPIYQRILSENPDRVDAWKGLLGSLHAANRDRDALAQIQQIPPATRKTLESDVEYLQSIGNIYNGLGQPQQAMVFLNRVQQRYIAQHATPPADIDIQNAYLLFNGQNDTGLYRQLLVLGSRPDLSDEQRRTVQTIWAMWAVRRSNQAAAAGNEKRALAILNATAKAFPDNPGVVKALASGYLRAGLPKQAVAIFKSQDMTTGSAADYKAAVGAGLAANDMKDAETWLRYGLNQYPRDGQMLGLAAKFEQARGDSGRAADYYKASLAAMPPADPGSELAYILNQPVALNPRALPSPTSAQDLASLLAPGQEDRNADGTRMTQAPARPYLPSMTNAYGQAPVQVGAGSAMPGSAGQGGYALPSSGAPAVPAYMANPNSTVRQTPTTQRLRDYAPPDPSTTPAGGYMIYPGVSQNFAPPEVTARPANQTLTASDSLPIPGAYAPLSTERDLPPADMAVNQQPEPYLAYQQEQVRRSVQQAQVVDDASFLATGPRRDGAQTGQFNGEVYGPYIPYVAPSQANGRPMVSYSASEVNSTTLRNGSTMKNARNTRVAPRSGTSVHPEIAAAEAAASRRRQSDPRSMMGQSNPPEDIDNGVAQNSQYVPRGQGQMSRLSSIPSTEPTNSGSSYTPQYNTQAGQTTLPQPNGYPQTAQSGGEAYGQQYPRPTGGLIAHRAPRRPVRQRSATAVTGVGPAGAPIFYPAAPTGLTNQPYPDLPPYNGTGPIPSDEQLIARNIPPLRGNYDPNGAAPPPPLTERQQTELDLATLEASYSAWMGGTGSVRYRSGRAGVERLFDYEIPFEATIVTGRRVRFSVIPKAVFLNSGTLDLTGVDPTTAAVPVLGTLPITAITAPAPQFNSGVGGEFQISGTNFGISVGYTPYEFLVSNIIGRARFRLFNHLTLFGERDSVKDTQLSIAGLRDPGSATPVFEGNIWGGVVSTVGGARFDLGDEKSGFYISGDGGTVTGYHVLDNKKIEGTMGAYFRVKQFPGVGSMTVGGSFFGMHYTHNERPLSYGNGGYFSPNVYFLGSVPVTFNGYYKTNFHYSLSGALGVQTFEEQNAKLFPLDPVQQSGAYSGCTLTQIAQHTCTTAEVARNTSTGANFNIGGQFSYRVAEHWYVGGALSANNTNNFTMVQPSFFARYLFRPQYPTEDYPTGLFPLDGLRPLRVP